MTKIIISLLTNVGIIVTIANQAVADPRILSAPVSTTTGTLRGHLVNVPGSGVDVYEFSAIPFAEPPIGENRYKKPIPKKPWNGEFLATKLPPECQQGPPRDVFYQSVGMSEDCLFLNVWVRKTSFEVQTSPVPIFFWIHGGGLTAGSSTETKYNGSMLAAYQNVIVVSIQYRLGPLGWAYLGIDDVPGNMGMWDALEALKWTYSNVAKFGGDPGLITIAGESAGAYLVSGLLLSAQARPYIHQAIVQSGSVLSSRAMVTPAQALERTNRMFPYLSSKYGGNCYRVSEYSSVDDKVRCLRSVEASFAQNTQMTLIEVDSSVGTSGIIDGLPWQPVIDGVIIPGDPVHLLSSGQFARVPIMTQNVKDEGTYFLMTIPFGQSVMPSTWDNKPIGWFDMNTYRSFIDGLFAYYPENGHKTDSAIKKAIETYYWHYGGPTQPPLSGSAVVDRTAEMAGDASYFCPTIDWAVAYQRYATVFQSIFGHATFDNSNPHWYGVSHGTDLQYTLGDALNVNLKRVSYTEQEKLLCKRVIQYIGNFLRTGNPNVADSSLSNQLYVPPWPAYHYKGDSLLLDGDGGQGTLLNSFKLDNCQFWYDLSKQVQVLARNNSNIH